MSLFLIILDILFANIVISANRNSRVKLHPVKFLRFDWLRSRFLRH